MRTPLPTAYRVTTLVLLFASLTLALSYLFSAPVEPVVTVPTTVPASALTVVAPAPRPDEGPDGGELLESFTDGSALYSDGWVYVAESGEWDSATPDVPQVGDVVDVPGGLWALTSDGWATCRDGVQGECGPDQVRVLLSPRA